jgi:hypothetical protein|tara:strand:+ start:64 stop:291 length:228 start_codon:yes stop_codon:yes gene_type:complete
MNEAIETSLIIISLFLGVSILICSIVGVFEWEENRESTYEKCAKSCEDGYSGKTAEEYACYERCLMYLNCTSHPV